jgi:hypothetical protein
VTTNQPVNKEEVRMLVATLGYKETSLRTGIEEPTLRQWSHRGQWTKVRQHPKAVTHVTASPADALADALQEHENATRLALAKAARKGTEHIAESDPEGIKRDSRALLQLGQTAGMAHKWNSGAEANKHFTLNVLNIGGDVEIDTDP